jgi:hypothetical protein
MYCQRAQILGEAYALVPVTMQGKPLLVVGILLAALLVAKDVSSSILPDISNGSLWSTPADTVRDDQLRQCYAHAAVWTGITRECIPSAAAMAGH